MGAPIKLIHMIILTLCLVHHGVLMENAPGHCTNEECETNNDNVYSIENQNGHTGISPGPSYVSVAPNIDNSNDNENGGDSDEEELAYEFPPVRRLDPGTVGDVLELELQPGKTYKRITRSVRPPVFEIPDFLTSAECDLIIEKAREQGLTTSHIFGGNIEDEANHAQNSSEIRRISKTTWIRHEHVNEEFWTSLYGRLTKLTGLPVGVLKRSEPIQVVTYGPAGHYHSHIDSTEMRNLPCCFQTRCDDKEDTPQWADCCRMCRLMTVLYYLNDVEAGGETAFPLADMQDDLFNEKRDDQGWKNLSKYCHNSSLVVPPKKGTAVMWYSHFIDSKGYLGDIDERSQHGGCDIIKGSKWIANNWLSIPAYENRFSESTFYTGP